MKRLLIILAILPLHCFSQQVSDLFLWNTDSTSKKNIVFLRGDGMISSNSFRSDLYNKLIFGGNISADIKDKNIEKLTTSNIAGGNAEASLGFIGDVSKYLGKGISAMIVYKQTLFNEIQFTKEIPSMALYGNTQFMGQTIGLKNNKFQSFSYSSISIGLSRTKNRRGNTYQVGASVGYNMGLSHRSAEVTSGQLKFASDGSAIDLSSTYFLSMTDTSKTNWLNGNGLTSSFFYQYIHRSNYVIGVSIEDLGFIKWNNRSMSEQKKVNHHFEGFEIADILKVNGDEIGLETDSILNSIIYPSKTESYYTKTPFKISVMGSYPLSKNLRLDGVIWKVANSYQRIGIMIKPMFTNIIPTVDFAPYFISNGYSGYDIGFEVVAKTLKNMLIKANIFSIPVKSRTLGGGILIGYRF